MMHDNGATMPADSKALQHGGAADAADIATHTAAASSPSNGRAIVAVPVPADADAEAVSKAVIAVEGGHNGSTTGVPSASAADDEAATPNGTAVHASVSPASLKGGEGYMDGNAGTSVVVPQPAAAVVKAAIDAGACRSGSLAWLMDVLILRAVSHDRGSSARQRCK
jgi:hypothetical protein